MNIDAEVRDILSRSFPVNDNNKSASSGCKDNILQTNSGIYIVGNNNIIVPAGLLMLASLLFFVGMLLIMSRGFM